MGESNQSLRDRLLGALVGLARCTDGSEHLITPELTAFLRHSLSCSSMGISEWKTLLREAEERKRAMVPDCFLCANPCGRTADYDLKEMEREPKDIQECKRQLLKLLPNAANTCQETILYDALVLLGMECCPPHQLKEVILKLNIA